MPTDAPIPSYIDYGGKTYGVSISAIVNTSATVLPSIALNFTNGDTVPTYLDLTSTRVVLANSLSTVDVSH